MKDLIKPLEWEYYSNGECAYSEVGGGAITYRVFSSPANVYARIEGNGGMKNNLFPIQFIDLDGAKAACQTHYNEMVFEGLSPEARAILEQHFNPTTPNT